jgi:hypothetical protein
MRALEMHVNSLVGVARCRRIKVDFDGILEIKNVLSFFVQIC